MMEPTTPPVPLPQGVGEPEWRRLNRASWDERAAVHVAASRAADKPVYDQTRLRAGTARLGPISANVLGPVDGLRVLHLQCHFGLDSLTILQMGAASLVGVDFSAPAIDAARMLAAELGLGERARFVVSDVYEAPALLPEPAGFDRVFVSWGALCWLPDMRSWARVIAHFLRPGGFLALAEAHPAAYVLDDENRTVDGRPGWFTPYLGRGELAFDNPCDYADPSASLQNSRTREWLHPLSDVIGGLLEAGLVLQSFAEHDRVAWKMFDCLVGDNATGFAWPDKPWWPLAYSLRAGKPVSTT